MLSESARLAQKAKVLDRGDPCASAPATSDDFRWEDEWGLNMEPGPMQVLAMLRSNENEERVERCLEMEPRTFGRIHGGSWMSSCRSSARCHALPKIPQMAKNAGILN